MKPQKALHLHLEEEKKKPKSDGITYAVMEKFDGWYMYIDCIDGAWGDIKSRANRTIPSMSKYSEKLKEELPKLKKNARLIFEAIVLDENGSPVEFKTVNGWFNRKAPINKEVTFKCHDLIIESALDRPFDIRYSNLQALIHKANFKPLELVEVLAWSSVRDVWMRHYEEVCNKYDDRGEGVILKAVDEGYYPDKKNFSLLKIKCEHTYELKVTGIQEGEGKYKHTLGKIRVEDANNNVNYISGMTDIERDHWWIYPSEIIGKIVEVKCMKVLSNKSLREGRFKAIRHDKTEPDTL